MTLFYEQEVAAFDGHDVDLFAGPGGWSEALRQLDRWEIGIEWDRWACGTRRRAGHLTLEADVSHVDPAAFVGAPGLIGSPPCQSFSTAGKQIGRDYLPELASAIDEGRWSARPTRNPQVWLVLEVGRWWEILQPEWVACEQVPAVLPLWERYADRMTAAGYSTWTGILNAADYGVPQIRKRAVLMAHRSRTVTPPLPTHGPTTATPWVTMAAALGWTGRVGFPRLDDRGDSPDGYRERDLRTTDEPSFTVTEKARSWTVHTGQNSHTSAGDVPYVRDADRPNSTITSQARSWTISEDDEPTELLREGWEHERPATTIAGDARVFAPGSHKANDGRDNTKAVGRSDEAIRISARDALILQGFRPDYPVAGGKTKQFEQIGNAIPPPLALAILRSLIYG